MRGARVNTRTLTAEDASFPFNHKKTGLLDYILVAALVLIVFYPYYFGYRLSRDDVWFLKVGMQGFVSVRDHAILVATEQGRIGQLLMLPLNVVGAFLAGNPLWRIIFLAAYVLQLLLFSIFVSRLLRQNVSLFLFVLLVSLHPLVFDNMPPNAYPLQNTVPLIIALAARLAILRYRQQETPPHIPVALAHLTFAFGMFISEFVVAFGTALIAAEYMARTQWARIAGSNLSSAIRKAFARHFVISDGLVLLAVLVPYVMFRLLNPSIYDGNSAGGLFSIHRVVGTAFGHIIEGTPVRFVGEELLTVTTYDRLIAIVVGMAVCLCLYRLSGPVLYIRRPWAVAAISLALAFYVTLPIAIATKYQRECVDWGQCGYLDSRISYLPMMVALMCVVSAIGQSSFRNVLTGAAWVVLGAVATLVSVYNAGRAAEMRRFDTVWLRADAVACVAPDFVRDETVFLTVVDPAGLVEMHPPSKPMEFWSVYIMGRAKQSCRFSADEPSLRISIHP